MNKFALLIGVSEYQSGFDPLPTTIQDVEAIKQLLVNPEIGEFAAENVTVLKNPQKPAMDEAIHNLYDDRQKDDLLLLYFSGHGLINDEGNFYFSTSSTKKNGASFISYLAVAASYVHERMKKSKSKYKVVILDSCFSGAFPQGMAAKDGGTINIKQHLGGQGTAILTASTSTQYAYEEEGSDLGIYTRYLVEGEALTLKGNTLVEDISAREALSQMIGFSPERVAQAQKSTIEAKNINEDIKARRTDLLNAFFMAVDSGDEDMLDRVLEKMSKFNTTIPELAINGETLSNSVIKRYQDRALANSTGGMGLDKKLIPRLEGMLDYGR
jgi:uncharacterized caspase-like protein